MPTASGSRGGFTLFELLLVVILIAVLYGVFINKLSSRTELSGAEEQLGVGTIATYLRAFAAQDGGEVTLICLDRCQTCDVYKGDEKVKNTTVSLFSSAPIVYRKDINGQFEPLEFLPRLNAEGVEEKVCFAFTLYANGSSSNYLMEYGGSFYLYDAYHRPTQTFASFEAAEAAYNRFDLMPDEKRIYDF